MARKNNGSAIPRRRKATAPAELAAVQPGNGQVALEAAQSTSVSDVAPRESSVNLDEEIRRRAYELYLQRNGAAGDPSADWLIAEREVRSRHAAARHSSTLAAGQGQS